MENYKWLLDNIVNLSIAIVAATWAIWNYFYSKKIEQTKILTGLYSKYNSKEMIKLRADLWLKLELLNNSNSNKSFSKLWTELDNKGQIVEHDTIMNIYEFGAFWNEILALSRSKLIKKTLAKQFFGYQYSYWKPQLYKLVNYTMKSDTDRPDIFDAFSSSELDWLEFGEPGIELYKTNKVNIG